MYDESYSRNWEEKKIKWKQNKRKKSRNKIDWESNEWEKGRDKRTH